MKYLRKSIHAFELFNIFLMNKSCSVKSLAYFILYALSLYLFRDISNGNMLFRTFAPY